MKKLLLVLLLAVLLVGCEDKDIQPFMDVNDTFDTNDIMQGYVECWESLAESVGELCEAKSNLVAAIAEAELVRNLNLRYDPNFYLITTNDVIIDKAVWLHIGFSDVNIDSVEEAALALRMMDTRDAKEAVDLEVTIGDETHTASFEDFFEWMGFKR